LILALVAVFLLRRVWPQPGWFSSVLAVLIAYELFGGVLHSLKRREAKSSDLIGPGAPPKYDWRKCILPTVWTLLLFAAMRLHWMLEKLHLSSSELVFLLPLALLGLAAGGLQQILGWLIDRAVARCNCDGALRLSHLFFWKKGEAPFVRGEVLLTAGRYPEAEAVLREGLGGAWPLTGLFPMLEDLGNVLMDTGRNEEARRCFESARDLKPDRSVARQAMAELLLRQGTETERALELAGRALKVYRGSLLERMTCPERLGETLAVHAWALALQGTTAEATRQIEQAFQGRVRKNRPAFAHVRFLAGMTMKALGRSTEAAEHFRGGHEADPAGRWGMLCAAALRESGSSGAEPLGVPIH
jgi:tetratricopeptide (TPR) repeat protein